MIFQLLKECLLHLRLIDHLFPSISTDTFTDVFFKEYNVDIPFNKKKPGKLEFAKTNSLWEKHKKLPTVTFVK